MAYIREQRGLPGWNPNTRHVVYGLDADLIMLGLSTHEPWFYILREMITAPQQKDPREALLEAARGLPAETKPAISKKPYQLLKIHVLREYLTMDMTPR